MQRDGGFQAALERLAEAHGQDVLYLNEENQHLRDQIQQLRDTIRQIQARSICAKIDEPKMQSVAQSVAEDVAGWIDAGGVEEETTEQTSVQDKPSAWKLKKNNTPAAKVRTSAHSGTSSLKPALRPAGQAASREGTEEAVELVKSVSFNHATTAGFKAGDSAGFYEVTEQGVVSTTTSEGYPKGKRSNVTKVLNSPEAMQVRNMAQQAIEASEMKTTSLSRALAMKKMVKKSVGDTVSAYKQPGVWLYRVVHTSAFDMLCAVMIMTNSVLIGITTQYLTVYPEESMGMVVMGHFCSGFFLIELLLRIFTEGRGFFMLPETRSWNMFDAVLVAFSIVEFFLAMNGSSGTLGQSVKTIKMLRILRLFRVFRFFKDLSLLALMVIDSMKSLMNALAMLVIITYVFAICFTVQASGWLQYDNNFTVAGSDKLDQHFGNLWKTLYALMQAMLSGISWGELTNALMLVDVFTPALFFFYVFFTMLAVLNIITGVFVDNAVETARTQRDYLVQKEMELKEKYVKEMQRLFRQMDEDNSGTVSLEEVKEYFEDPNVRSYFTALGLDPEDSERLFSLLDDDGSGDVGVNEFIDGCLRLKGQARSIDIYALLIQCNRMEIKLKEVLELLPKAFRKSEASIMEDTI